MIFIYFTGLLKCVLVPFIGNTYFLDNLTISQFYFWAWYNLSYQEKQISFFFLLEQLTKS